MFLGESNLWEIKVKVGIGIRIMHKFYSIFIINLIIYSKKLSTKNNLLNQQFIMKNVNNLFQNINLNSM